MAIRANIAIGEQNGMNDKTFMTAVSTLPELMHIIGTINVPAIIIVSGPVNGPISSIFDAREPREP